MNKGIAISDITSYLESLAPLALQENYDNSGLQTGNPSDIINGVILTIDVTEDVVDEAIEKNAGLIIAHHPVIFSGLKRITGNNMTEKILIKAIQNRIAIYAAHTNLDNIAGGVNTQIARRLGLENQKILKPAGAMLRKMVIFVPASDAEKVRQALFDAGAGHIGNYDNCSFNLEGSGTFRGNEDTNPYVGEKGKTHTEPEIRVETIYPVYLEKRVIAALTKAHPYEEVAYDLYPLENKWGKTGADIIGTLPSPVDEPAFLETLRQVFGTPSIRHSQLLGKEVRSVAICGGSGSFLLNDAIAAKADFFITGDIKYHQFFDAAGKLVMADIGHFESEQFTKELFLELLTKKFSTFAVRLSEVNTNPVHYY